MARAAVGAAAARSAAPKRGPRWRTPHPWKSFEQLRHLADEAAVGRIPRTNINCTETLRRRPPTRAGRAWEADRVWEIDTGHDLMITEPKAVAKMLLRLASL